VKAKGKTSAVFPCAGRLYLGVQREVVQVVGDLVDLLNEPGQGVEA
jgi:hypothetical protein